MSFSSLIGPEAPVFGRIQPTNYIPPEGEHAFCLGADVPGFRLLLAHGDKIELTQNGDFDVTEIFRFRARTRAPEKRPWVVNVTSPVATGAYTVTINSVAHTYQADTAGLLFGSGAAASIDARVGSLTTVGGLTGMTEASVGRRLVVSGAATGANNGTFPIDEFVDANTVKIRNAAGVPLDANDGSISWEERRRPDNQVTISSALAKLITDGAQPMSALPRVDGIFQIDPDDADDANALAVSGNMTLHRVSFVFSFLIDAGVRATQKIADRSRVRDRFDLGTLVTNVSAGNHDLTFRLEAIVEPALTGADFEVELPGVYIDQLVYS